MSELRAVLYGRVSRDRSEGRSVDDQLSECRSWAGREGWQVVAEHRDDGISASRYAGGKARPGWQSTMDLISAGRVDLLVVWEVSRASRDRAVWSALLATCQEHGVRIGASGRLHDPADPDDGFMLDLGGALAVRESAQTSKRIKRQVRSAAAAGRPHGKIPYGYRREYDPVSREGRQLPDEKTAPVVAEIAARLLAGEALYAVAADLNARGITAPRGGLWDLRQVKRVAISPTNAGLRTHLGEVTGVASWAALISETDHRTLVDRLTEPGRRSWRDGAPKHLLSMIAVCGVCGSPCRRVKNRNTPSYICGQRFCVACAQSTLDAYVTEVVIARLSRPDVWDLFIETPDPELAAAKVKLAELRAQYREFEGEAIAGRLAAASWARIETQLSAQIKAADRAARPRGLPAVVLDTAGPDAATHWDALSVPQRRELVRALLTPRILRAGKGYRVFNPDRIEIDWK
ncbi:MAG: recombinase family protein [Pseudonocardiaceae bacterium]